MDKEGKEYEKNINSGDPVLIAEVVEIFIKEDSLEQQSYSERANISNRVK